MAEDNERPIIKKVKKVQGGGAHGGAWKVAYADFVTAMMAFFMLLWLLNVAPPETLSGLADYFRPTTSTSTTNSGGGDKPLAEGMSVTKGGNPNVLTPIRSDTRNNNERNEAGDGKGEGNEEITADPEEIKKLQIEEMKQQRAKEDDMYEDVIQNIELSLQQSSTLFKHSDHILMEVTEDGLKIQLIDQDKRPMFRRGNDQMVKFAEELLNEIGGSIQNLDNRITIEGHTDSTSRESRKDYTNWELSSDRANTARRVLLGAGVTGDRFFQIVGRANTAPLYPNEPARNENRRITIVLMRETPPIPKDFELR